MSIAGQFDDLLRDIEPSPTTVKRASAAHTDLRRYLKAHGSFSAVHINTFLAGSYVRDTSIRPRMIGGALTKPDIDIIVETAYGLHDEPKVVLKELRDVLAEEYDLDGTPHQRSVGVLTDHVEMDVVPIIAPYGEGGPFYLPDKKAEKWQQTNPGRHTTWATEANKATGGRFKPLVKLHKWWRRESPTAFKRPKGFVLECIVAECMDRTEKRYPELFVGTLEAIVRKYELTVALGEVPWVADPGVSGSSVTSQLTVETFAAFVKKAKAHAEVGRAALAESDPEKALKKWRQIFGDRFPTAKSAAKGGLLGAAAIPAATYSFPDRPLVPKKPGGFA